MNAIDELYDGARVRLVPLPENPLHRRPVLATFSGGYFFADGTPPEEGPDYYMGDVLRYCQIESSAEKGGEA